MSLFHTLIEGAATYLTSQRHCEEDRIHHVGRRSYTWQLLRWLHDETGDDTYRETAAQIASEVAPHIQKNSSGMMVVLPGSHARRNYSTNAIDCGIVMDSFVDLLALYPEVAAELQPGVHNIVTSYLPDKLTTARHIHNQYLWCAAGGARWLNNVASSTDRAMIEPLLNIAVDTWLQAQGPDGSSPYNSNPGMPGQQGVSPYYHSRCIAFATSIANVLKRDDDATSQPLLAATKYLRALYLPTGYKNMHFECKRYYFNGPHEVASHPYDIFAFVWAHKQTGDEEWLQFAGQALRQLSLVQADDGSIQSHSQTGYLPDWQCPLMRTGHVAWLTKIDADTRKAIEKFSSATPTLPLPELPTNTTLRCIPLHAGWLHFTTKATPLIGHGGHCGIGLLTENTGNINSLSQQLPLQYYKTSWSPAWLLREWRAVLNSCKWAALHAWDCLVYKKRPAQAWGFVWHTALQYIWTGLTKRSTAFATELTKLTPSAESITHDLVMTDVNGKHPQFIGTRTITWGAGTVAVKDELVDDMRPAPVPSGWKHKNGGRVHTYKTRG